MSAAKISATEDDLEFVTRGLDVLHDSQVYPALLAAAFCWQFIQAEAGSARFCLRIRGSRLGDKPSAQTASQDKNQDNEVRVRFGSSKA